MLKTALLVFRDSFRPFSLRLAEAAEAATEATKTSKDAKAPQQLHKKTEKRADDIPKLDELYGHSFLVSGGVVSTQKITLLMPLA